MSMGIRVNEFKYIPGKNDAEYIKLLKEAIGGLKHVNAVALKKIKELSADPWIPCKERLPNDDMRVLVDDGRQIEVMKWDLMRGCFYDNHAHDYDRSEILAWMPLPEPYKESENV